MSRSALVEAATETDLELALEMEATLQKDLLSAKHLMPQECRVRV